MNDDITTIANATVERLSDRIGTVAHIIARDTGVDVDEAQQEVALAILESAHGDGGMRFLRQTDSYIVNRATWRARDAIRKVRRQQNRCLPLEAAKTVAISGPEAIVANLDVQTIIASLNGTLQRVAHGLMCGDRKQEVAAVMHVSPAAISYHVRRLRRALAWGMR
jgi:DNA-directed RNA polymerase specialized sigma24 family protein